MLPVMRSIDPIIPRNCSSTPLLSRRSLIVRGIAGTGNGQAAIDLAIFFDRVVATDASEEQIRNAKPNERIEYRVARAEESGLRSRSIDLITVAQALHWFDLDLFYLEAKGVLKPQGLLAAWCYHLLQIVPEIDAIVNKFYRETVGSY
jgi:ubiquinone/menaquinone biosynthesis C-methylase UbiE